MLPEAGPSGLPTRSGRDIRGRRPPRSGEPVDKTRRPGGCRQIATANEAAPLD